MKKKMWNLITKWKCCKLSKYVEMMLFGVVFIEKNIKPKKNSAFENLLPHMLTTEAL